MNLRKLIRIIRPKKDNIYEKEGDYIVLAKADLGQSFKGHAFNITYQKEGGKEKGIIIRRNQYYGGAVNEKYDIDENKTYIDCFTHGFAPKWLQRKQKAIINFGVTEGGGVNNSYIESDSVVISDNPQLTLYSNSYALVYKKEENGVYFNTHRDNIDELRQLNLFYREIRNKIKCTKIEDIIKHVEDPTVIPLTLSKTFLP